MEAQDQKITEAVFSWQFLDVIKHRKNIWWHVGAVVIVAGAIWLCIHYNDPLFAVFLGLFYLVVLLYDVRPARLVDFIITPDGIKVGNIFHYYKEFSHFYVIYQDRGVKNLYLEFRNVLRGRLVVLVEGQNAVAIREYLLGFLTEDLEREAEPLSERINRWLKL